MYFDPNQRQWILAGITSYGTGCGLPSYAGVYTRVSMYNSWLQPLVTDGISEVPVNATRLISSGRTILSSYWSLIGLLLYILVQR